VKYSQEWRGGGGGREGKRSSKGWYFCSDTAPATVGLSSGYAGAADGASIIPLGMTGIRGPFLRFQPPYLGFHFLVVLILKHDGSSFACLEVERLNGKRAQAL
jgi:hypothetical protein